MSPLFLLATCRDVEKRRRVCARTSVIADGIWTDVLYCAAMKEYVKRIDEMVDELPPERQAEVREFVEFLLAKQRLRQRRKPQFGWAGALKELRDEFSSVELQHEITRLRGEAQ